MVWSLHCWTLMIFVWFNVVIQSNKSDQLTVEMTHLSDSFVKFVLERSSALKSTRSFSTLLEHVLCSPCQLPKKWWVSSVLFFVKQCCHLSSLSFLFKPFQLPSHSESILETSLSLKHVWLFSQGLDSALGRWELQAAIGPPRKCRAVCWFVCDQVHSLLSLAEVCLAILQNLTLP